MSKPVHSDSHRPVSSAAVAEQSRSLRSSKPAVHYHLATPPAAAGQEQEEEEEEQQQEVIQDPIIVGPINPIQPLQINFDVGANGDNGDQENLTNMAEERALLPSHFRGTPEEDAAEWWRRLNTYNQFKANDDAAKLRLAKALFIEAACDWLDNLETQKKDTYDHLETAFKERYIQPSVLRFRSACELFGKKQRSDESVDAYVSRLRTLSKKVDVDDKALLYALLSGLKSPMASYVLGKNPQTFAEAVDAARLAEFSVVEGASHADQQLCTQLAEMRQDIQKLAQRYDSMSLTAAIQRERTRSPTPPPRKVTFQGDGATSAARYATGPRMINPNYFQNPRGYFSPRYNNASAARGVGSYSRFPQYRARFGSNNGQPQTQRNVDRCNKCGRAAHQNVNFCPAINQQCNFCGRFGHFKVVCRQAK